MKDKAQKNNEIQETSINEQTTVARLLVRCLENEDVEYVFGIPGEENIHFMDALKSSSSIRFSLLRDGKTDSDIRSYILESIQKKPEGIIAVIRTKALRPTLNLMNRIGG